MSANLIYTHPNGARLYQGGAKEILEALKDEPISLVVLAAKEVQRVPGLDSKLILNMPMDDDFTPNMKKYIDTLCIGIHASQLMAKHIINGNSILTTCAMGWNRSGLLNGLTLKRLTNCPGQDAINLIKEKRGIMALSNPAFIHMLK